MQSLKMFICFLLFNSAAFARQALTVKITSPQNGATASGTETVSGTSAGAITVLLSVDHGAFEKANGLNPWNVVFEPDTLSPASIKLAAVKITLGPITICGAKRLLVSAETMTAVDSETNGALPTRFALEQNYPNPFNPSTAIFYAVVKSGQVKLQVFNQLGQRVATLVNEHQVAGIYKIDFNAKELPSGLYFYRIETGDFSKTIKMILMK